MVISVAGSTQQVNAAFRTGLAYVSTTDEAGKPWTYRTNLSALQVPAALAGKIVSIDGLDTSIRHIAKNTTTLTPTLFRAAYGAAQNYGAGNYGKGIHIAIANWDGYRLSNVPLFVSAYGLPVPSGGAGSNVTIVKVGTGSTTYGQGTAQGEGDLDIQAVISAAPLASILDYDDSTNDSAAPITTLSKLSSDNLADFVTESYGWETSSGNTYYGSTWTSAHNLHLSLTSQGITYLAATGDNGTSAFPSRGARYAYPDIDPEVLQVGGSVVTVNSTTGAYVSEASWGLSGGVGGTGGFDPYDTPARGFAFNAAPSYQTTYIGSKTSKYAYRLLPDIASSAGGQNGLGSRSGSGWAYNVYYNGSLSLFDGTSIASPCVAGALGAIQGALADGRWGRMQDYLYAIGSNASVFHDITSGSSIGNLPGTSTAASPTTGWDFATGWGSLNFGGLQSYILSSGTKP